MMKLSEGLTKGVSPEVIATAAGQRFEYLKNARTIVETADPELRVDEVIVPAALAMESGLAERNVVLVVEAGRGRGAKDIRTVIEAGEALHLAGFSSEDIEPILEDCLNRNLRRHEIRRVVRYASQQRERGMETHRIRRSLWGTDAQGSQHQHRHQEQNGHGPGGGPGPGGPERGGHGRP
jgi:hypothetical protein